MLHRAAQTLTLVIIGLMLWAGSALFIADDAEARGGYRAPRISTRHMKPTRMKTYHFNGKDIRGYRNFVRQRREAKLASGGFTLRKDGSVVHKDMHIRMGRASAQSPLRPRPAASPPGTILGQCRNGTAIQQPNIHWACRDGGGIGWSHQPPRISGIRDY